MPHSVWVYLLIVVLVGTTTLVPSLATAKDVGALSEEIRIVEIENTVEISPRGAQTWVATQTNQVLHPSDRLRTGRNSRAALVWSSAKGQSVVSFDALTEVQILRTEDESGLSLFKGILSFFHRDKPARFRVVTAGANAGIEGTEFVIAVDAAERTTLSVIDGRVKFFDPQGELVLTNSQEAIADVGQPPQFTAVITANNLLQWNLYYPAILDLDELPWAGDEPDVLQNSLASYRAGDLLGALVSYPTNREPDSDAERIYYAALLLSVGQVEQTETILSSISATNQTNRLARLATALRVLIAAVKRESNPAVTPPQLATELLAASYFQQAQARREISLTNALFLARQAATISPESGFAWERVAELEFSFGHTSRALEALHKSLALAPRNAQAITLKGFLLAAENKIREAIEWFDQAIAIDPALGNAWLGRGLCRIRHGDLTKGREDLLIAAALEPQRAILRSYLGKAWSDYGDDVKTRKELSLARKLDPNDPTSWLYSALNNEQHNRINEAIRDLEKSQELNDNRSVYRSGPVLDQDRAVRSANLARIYQDAGLDDVAVREASKSVSTDYGNYSAHLFLANSYQQLLDPNFRNLRYETPTSIEFLLANLLAPVDAGWLSPAISQQEYGRLFERNRLGIVASAEYLSRGAGTISGAQYGRFDHLSYSIDAFYRTDPGQRPNNDTDQRFLSISVRQQLTADDNLLIQVSRNRISGGDLSQVYDPHDPTQFNSSFRFREIQEPSLNIGYHHHWSPGSDTLLLTSYNADRLAFTSETLPTLLARRPGGIWRALFEINLAESLKVEPTIGSIELQQIFQTERAHTVVGSRFHYGHYEVNNFQDKPDAFTASFDPNAPDADQHYGARFLRWVLYGYETFRVFDSLQIIGGVSYDDMSYPENFRDAPVSRTEQHTSQLSPKAGVLWTPTETTTIRGAYTRSLAGPAGDQSLQIEPSQLAGFIQSYRSLIPESVVGAQSGARFETFGLALDQKFATGTYIGLSGEILYSDVSESRGVFDAIAPPALFAVPFQVRERLSYRERSLTASFHQLIGASLAVGMKYRLTDALLRLDLPEVPATVAGNFPPRQVSRSLLHQVSLDATLNHSSGLFARAQALWNLQSNGRDLDSFSGDEFWQFNLYGGYYFPQRRAQLSVGLLNIFNNDYLLHPLTSSAELPRQRTLLVQCRFNF
ncbi:MAG: TonB-dependent receptor [Verrucomicrobiota bacterium]